MTKTPNVNQNVLDSEVPIPLLQVRGLTKRFPPRERSEGPDKTIPGIFDVCFDVAQDEILALAGPSGSGKTTILRCLTGITRMDSGSVIFEGAEMSALRGQQLLASRRNLQIVFQDAYTTLDPRMSIERVLAEPLVVHGIGDRKSRARAIAKWVSAVGLQPSLLARRPSELSIGERQRVAIARALLLRPRLLLLDEPTAGLDVLLRYQIVELLARIIGESKCAAIIATHDLELVAALADRVALVRDGRLVEHAQTENCRIAE